MGAVQGAAKLPEYKNWGSKRIATGTNFTRSILGKCSLELKMLHSSRHQTWSPSILHPLEQWLCIVYLYWQNDNRYFHANVISYSVVKLFMTLFLNPFRLTVTPLKFKRLPFWNWQQWVALIISFMLVFWSGRGFFATIAASRIDGMRMLMNELLHRYDVHWVWILMHALLFSDRHTNFRGATLQFYSHACVTIRVSTLFEPFLASPIYLVLQRRR